MKAMRWTRRAACAASAVVLGGLALAASPAAASPAAARAKAAVTRASTQAKTPASTWSNPLLKTNQKTGVVPGTVIAVLPSAHITGTRLRSGSPDLTPRTSDAAVNTTLTRLGAQWIRPLFPALTAGTARALTAAARQAAGGAALDLGGIVVIHVTRSDSIAAARTLAATSGVTFAEPDRYVNTMNTGGQPLPANMTAKLPAAHAKAPGTAAASGDLPGNYGYASSLQSFLNAQGDDTGGAYASLQAKYGQLPGTGEIITNVSVGDLTDESMADNGDGYVKYYGPTTILQNGQRYLDLPSMPLVPAYVAESDGLLSGTASVEGVDPVDGEIDLDFGVMAPLPDADQRAGATGSGDTDLLGIAPGAQYRLVVPSTPTIDQIAQAFLAAATQSPAPDVITASLGFGTDTTGFPGRYLEEDPVMEAVIASIVRHYGIVVVDSANDGTRLYTPAAVGPDGGATPTGIARTQDEATNIDDDAASTTPGEVVNSGSIAAGATTLDDTLATPPNSANQAWRNPAYAEIRTDGSGNFASGFGQRITLSAPGDNIAAFEHAEGGQAQAVYVVLNGGTSASAPEIAAAAAVVLQAARLTGHQLDPAQVTRVLERTGHSVATPPQADQPLNVGPQIDLTAAVDSLLGKQHPPTTIVRLSVAHRQILGESGAEFEEDTDPGRIDLQGPGTGQYATGEGLVGPVTFAADIEGPRGDNYALVVDGHVFRNTADFIRVTPAELLAAAGLPLVASADRTIQVTYQVRQGARVLAQVSQPLVISGTDGTYAEAQPPAVPPVVAAGRPVTVSYDLTGVRTVEAPALVVSTVGHWNPQLGPVFSAAWTLPLTALKGTVTVPASAFDGGGGIYGIGIEQDTASRLYGDFASVRVSGFTAASRPAAPTLALPGGPAGHAVEVSRAAPSFTLHWDAGRGARGAVLEFSAPGPTAYNSLNTFNNPNGTQRDADGIETGSLIYQNLPGPAGTATFNALALGLPTSLSYDVRILPTDRSGAVTGQASPISQLTVDDGLVPDGGVVTSFAIAGADSVAAIANPEGSQVVRYDPATGTYGGVIASDPAGGEFDVYGVDPAAHTVLVGHDTSSGIQVELYDTAAGALIGQPDLSGYQIEGGRVDAATNQAALLAVDTSTRDDTVFPVSMTTGAAGTPINADTDGVAPGTFHALDLDATSGQVFLSALGGGGPCFGGTLPDADVNPGTGTVTIGSGGSRCDVRMAADQAGGQVITIGYRAFSVNIAGTALLGEVSQGDLTRTATYSLRTGTGIALAVDGQHHLAAVLFELPAGQPLFGYPQGFVADSNAMSEIDIVDTTTGQIVRKVDDFIADPSFGGAFDAATERSVELDPATRTGYIYGPGEAQIEQFSY